MATFSASLVSAAALVIVAFLTFLLNKKLQIEAAWRDEKLGYYREFIDALSSAIEGDATPEGHLRFARATNNIHLVGSEEVLNTMHAYRDQIALSNSAIRDYDKDEALLSDLIVAMRHDLRMPNRLSRVPIRLYASGNNPRPPRSSL
jgi:hypothetical protein